MRAALETLKEVGFAGASARAIARRGGFNPALIFYHFGTVNELLIAALDETSRERMERYRVRIEEAHDLASLLRVAGEVYREDLASGHIKALAEMIAGASSAPDLGPRIVERIEPWVELTREAVERVVGGGVIAQLAPPRDVAFAIVSLYLGMELLTHLEGDERRAVALFGVAETMAGLLGGLIDAQPA